VEDAPALLAGLRRNHMVSRGVSAPSLSVTMAPAFLRWDHPAWVATSDRYNTLI
jgi:hypothetical protein